VGPVVLAGTVMLRKDLYHGAVDETVRSFKCETECGAMNALDVWESQFILFKGIYLSSQTDGPLPQLEEPEAQCQHAASASRPLGHMSSL
jgi:hypothetical protein